jgi:hypothetical protein
MKASLSPLERRLVEVTAAENWPDFRIEGVRVQSRENTGAGRYTTLEDTLSQPISDGAYSAQGKLIEMDGVRNGLGFVIHVARSRINMIELFMPIRLAQTCPRDCGNLPQPWANQRRSGQRGSASRLPGLGRWLS